MRILTGLVLLLAAFLPTSATAQQGRWIGHWVNVDPADYALFVLDIQPDALVHQLIPAPQFQAKYRLEAGQLVMRMGDGSADSSFVLRGDSLIGRGPDAMVRIPGSTVEKGGVRGTWRAVVPTQMHKFLTFRSDTEVVLEIGFPVVASWSGDTLRLSSMQAPSVAFTMRQAGDTLHALDTAGKDHRFIRRPWGCLGIGDFDTPAPECR